MKTKERKPLRAPKIKDGCTEDGRLFVEAEESFLLLSIGRSSGYIAIHNGQIPSIKIGGKYLVPVQAIEALLAGGSASNGNPAA